MKVCTALVKYDIQKDLNNKLLNSISVYYNLSLINLGVSMVVLSALSITSLPIFLSFGIACGLHNVMNLGKDIVSGENIIKLTKQQSKAKNEENYSKNKENLKYDFDEKYYPDMILSYTTSFLKSLTYVAIGISGFELLPAIFLFIASTAIINIVQHTITPLEKNVYIKNTDIILSTNYYLIKYNIDNYKNNPSDDFKSQNDANNPTYKEITDELD